MAPTLFTRQNSNFDDNYDSTTSSFNRTRSMIIIVIAVIFALKICLLIYLCHYRNRKRAERAARGCHCYDNVDYYCLPWWYWGSDRHCRCGELQQNAWPAGVPQAYQPVPAYPGAAHPATGYYGAQREMNISEPYGYGNEPMEMQPTYAPPQPTDSKGGLLADDRKAETTPEVRVQYA